MAHRAGDDHRQHQLTVLVSKRRIEVATYASSSHRLTETFVQHRSQVQSQRFVHEIDGSGSGHCANVERSFEVIGISDAVANVKGPTHAGNRSVAFRSATEFANLAQFVQ